MCSKKSYNTLGQAKKAAAEILEKYGSKQQPYKCYKCNRWCLTSKQPERARKYRNRRGSSNGNKRSKHLSNRRRVYRRDYLPIENWENEGGAILRSEAIDL